MKKENSHQKTQEAQNPGRFKAKYPFPPHSLKPQYGGICPHRLYFNFNNICKRNKCVAGF